jgi:hypothetical protein
MSLASCDLDFDNKLVQFLNDAGYDLCTFADTYGTGVTQLNADFKYNLMKIIDGIKQVYTLANWKTAFDLILTKGVIIKCYIGEGGKTAIYIGGVDDFLTRFGD